MIKEPLELTCATCGQTKPYRSKPDKEHTRGRIMFPGWRRAGGGIPPKCLQCKYKEYWHQRRERKFALAENRRVAAKHRESGTNVVWTVRFPRDEISHRPAGPPETKCTRYAFMALAAMRGKLDHFDVKTTRADVAVTVHMSILSTQTEEAFRARCLANMRRENERNKQR